MAWDDTVTDNSSKLTAANYNAMVTDQKLRAYSADLPDGRITQTLSYTQDEERRFFKDDFSSDTSDNYTGDVDNYEWNTTNGTIQQLFESYKKLYLTQLSAVGDTFRVIAKHSDTSYNGEYIRLIFNYVDADNYCYVRYDGNYHPYKFGYVVSGVDTTVVVTGTTNNTSEYCNHFIEFTSTTSINIGMVDGSGTLTSDTITLSDYGLAITSFTVGISIVGYKGTSNEMFVKSIALIPSISDNDDFSVDTTARWAAVTGTEVFDTDHINLTTASGADGKGTYRRRSYLNEDGSQKINVTLPTGADGDFVTLVTHSESADMSDGIGIGLQSDGAGNWNLATLDGTTVTEGSDSGLDDADVATFEIEKDISGAYWYYIYDSTGAKPTTPTGKLFTTLKRGYTGLYCNGAGATTQTFAITDFECRCNTVVGDTNCESTEEYFFRDDFSEDSLDRYAGQTSGYEITSGEFQNKSGFGTGEIYIDQHVSDYTIDIDVTFSEYTSNIQRFRVLFGMQDDDENDAYTFRIDNESDGFTWALIKKFDGSGEVIQTYIPITLIHNTKYHVKITKIDGIIKIFVDGTQIGTDYTDSTYDFGKCGIYIENSVNTDVTKIDTLQISGTRVYPTPMLRGTQVGLYNDGDEDIVCTAFSDDFEADSSGEYTIIPNTGTVTFDNMNAIISHTGSTREYIIVNNNSFTSGYYSIDINRNSSSDNYNSLGLFCCAEFNAGGIYNGYRICLDTKNEKIILYKFINGESVLGDSGQGLRYTSPYHSNETWYNFTIVFDSNSKIFMVYINSEYICSILDTDSTNLSYGYSGIYSYDYDFEVSNNMFRNLEFNAISPDAPNGISYCIPSVNHGGRWGTTESITQTIPMTNVVSADLKGYSSGISTLTTESAALRITAKNNTDDTEIDASGTDKYWDVTMDGTLANTRKALETNFNDMDDSIVFTHSTDSGVPDGCIYVRETIVKPITVVMEADLT